MPEIVYTESCIRGAKKFLKRYPDMLGQYEKTLRLLELNPSHPSLKLHRLAGPLSELYSISINISYRITLDLLIREDTIIPVKIGTDSDAAVRRTFPSRFPILPLCVDVAPES